MKNLWHVGDGRHIGYCTRCGGDVFNGPRHRCPRKIQTEAARLIMAARQLFDELGQAIKDHNAQVTVQESEGD